MMPWTYDRWYMRSDEFRARVKIVQAPIAEPVSLAEAYYQLREDYWVDHPNTAQIMDEISAARAYCEGYTGRALAPQMVEIAMDSFGSFNPYQYQYQYYGSRSVMPLGIVLPYSPISLITGVSYYDEANVLTEADPALYELDDYSQPPQLRLTTDSVWPLIKTVTNGIKVRYMAGYSASSDSPQDKPIPPDLKRGILLMLTHLHENPSATSSLKLAALPMGIEALLSRYDLNDNFA